MSLESNKPVLATETSYIGYVMFYVRTPQPYGQDAMAGALALLWQVMYLVFCHRDFQGA